MIKEIIIILIIITPCVGISLSITSNNNAGFERTAESVSMNTLGEFYCQDTIGSDFRFHIDKGSSSDNCAFSLTYWIPFPHSIGIAYSVNFISQDRDTIWQDELCGRDTEFGITSTTKK
jgi:hypothetical protein